MKYKKGLIFVCLIICLFSIASVCASEVNDTTIDTTNAENNIDIDESILSDDDSNIGGSSTQEDSTINNIADSDSDKLEINNYEFNYDSKIKDDEIPKNEDYEFTVDAVVDGDSVDITVNLPRNISAPILIDVNGVGYYANATGGQAKLHLDSLSKGNYEIIARYIGDAYYAECSNTTSFVIFNTTLRVQVIALNVTFVENTVFIIDTIDEFKGNVSIKVEDKLLYNGSVKLVIVADKLTRGYKTATIVFYGDGRYDELTLDNVKFCVRKIKVQIDANEVTATYNVNKNLVITLKDGEGNTLAGQTLTVDFNGAKTYITDANGQIKMPTKGLVPKTYTARITFNGNDECEGSTNDVKITVKKATPKLTAAKKSYKAKVKTKKYTITLKDNKRKAIKKAKVTLKVKGKTYKATTNKKGKATFKITKLTKKGKHTATVKFTGTKYYKAITKKVKITVK